MKKLIYIGILLSMGIIPNVLAQKIGNLNGIYYQAVAVDETGKEIVGTDISGKPLYNKAIGVRFAITKGLNGPVQWEETHTTTTDKFGLFTLIIGKGTSTGAAPYPRMLDIPWIEADQYLKVELAIKNDGNYKLVSNQQFMAVPYSFYTDDIAEDAITTLKILDSTILNQDLRTGSVDTRTLLDSTILNRDLRTGSVDSRTILDSTITSQDFRTGAVDSRIILDSTILNQDLSTGSVDTRTLLDSSVINQDLSAGSVDSRSILDFSIANQDLLTGSVDSRIIQDSTLANQDLRTSSVDSRTLLDSTILNQDLSTGSIDSRSILDSSIANQDLLTGSVDSRIVRDSSLINQDFNTGAIDSRLILDGSLQNEDLADSTIDLASKVTGILPVMYGGTGADSLAANSLLLGNDRGGIHALGKATDGQIPVGITDSLPKLKTLAGKDGVKVTITADSVLISSGILSPGIKSIQSIVADTINPGIISIFTTWLSPPIAVEGATMESVVIGSIPVDLNGCQMTTFVSEPGIIKVAITNLTSNFVDLGTNRNLKVVIMN